jgi:hypothetical protein
MKLTKKKAKELSIEKWQLIYDNNWHLWNFDEKLEGLGLDSGCPLCELYSGKNNIRKCNIQCPLEKINQNCFMDGSYFNKWAMTNNPRTRKKYAGLILQTIKDWKI